MNFHRKMEIFLSCKFCACLHLGVTDTHSLLLDDSPANGEFTVELAVNRAFTTLSYNGSKTTIYGDGQDHPGLGVSLEGKVDANACITNPNSEFFGEACFAFKTKCVNFVVHTQNESMAAGTIFAISYTSDVDKVTEDNLVVFTVLPK